MKYRIKLVPILGLLIVLLGVGFIAFPSFPYDLRDQTFKGSTKDGTLIALNFTIKKGEITGYGYHLSEDGEEKYVSIIGEIQCETGRLDMYESLVAEDHLLGTIRGRISETQMNLIAVWSNLYGANKTPINLIATSKTPKEVLNTESSIRTRENTRKKVKKAKDKVLGIIDAIF